MSVQIYDTAICVFNLLVTSITLRDLIQGSKNKSLIDTNITV